MNLTTIGEILWDIRSTSSTLEKEAILRANKDVEDFQALLKWLFNPYSVTGIGKKKLDKATYYGASITTATEMLDYLDVNNTGTDYDVHTAKCFIAIQEAESPYAGWLAEAMMLKDIQIGVSVTTLKNVFGSDFIPTVGIMRGMHAPANFKGLYFATEKIDGNRRLIFNKPNGPEVYTRSGRRDKGLVEIEEQARLLPMNYMLDTECIAVGDYVDSIELRQASASILNSRGKRKGVRALAFDMLPIEEYNKGYSKGPTLSRKTLLAKTLGDAAFLDKMLEESLRITKTDALHKAVLGIWDASPLQPNSDLHLITALPLLGLVTNMAEAEALANPIWETGGEGIMLAEWRSPYEVNPNPRPTLLKIKATKELVVRCTGVYEGINKYTGMLGGINIVFAGSDGKVHFANTGSGFNDYQRMLYWNENHRIIGKDVEIEHFGESRNKQGELSLNCPIFKRIKGQVD